MLFFFLFLGTLTVLPTPLSAVEEPPWFSILQDFDPLPSKNVSRASTHVMDYGDWGLRMDIESLCTHSFCSCQEPWVLQCNCDGAQFALKPFENLLPTNVTEVRKNAKKNLQLNILQIHISNCSVLHIWTKMFHRPENKVFH